MVKPANSTWERKRQQTQLRSIPRINKGAKNTTLCTKQGGNLIWIFQNDGASNEIPFSFHFRSVPKKSRDRQHGMTFSSIIDFRRGRSILTASQSFLWLLSDPWQHLCALSRHKSCQLKWNIRGLILACNKFGFRRTPWLDTIMKVSAYLSSLLKKQIQILLLLQVRSTAKLPSRFVVKWQWWEGRFNP